MRRLTRGRDSSHWAAAFPPSACAAALGSLQGRRRLPAGRSLRAALAVGVALNLISAMPTMFSQLRKLRTVPATVLEHS
jgi:hypothetical protein